MLIQEAFNQVDKIALAEAEFDKHRETHDIAARVFSDEDIRFLVNNIVTAEPIPASLEKAAASEDALKHISAQLEDLSCPLFWKKRFESQLVNMGHLCDNPVWTVKKSNALQILRLRDYALTMYEDNHSYLKAVNLKLCTLIEQKLEALEDFATVYNWPAERTGVNDSPPSRPDPTYELRPVVKTGSRRARVVTS